MGNANLVVLVATAVLLTAIAGCAPTGRRMITYYDPQGRVARTVAEDAYNGKYSQYREIVTAIAKATTEGKVATIAALQEMSRPVSGESADLASFKRGLYTAMIAQVSAAGPEEAIRVIHYGKDEHDVQLIGIEVGGKIITFGIGAAGAVLLADAVGKVAGDVAVGEGSTYAPKEVHLTGNDLGDGNSIDISSDSPQSTITETVTAQ